MNTSQSILDFIGPTLQACGFPGALLLVIGYTFKKCVKWAMPHVESMIQAYTKRQQTMEDCQVRLTDTTIAIQNEVLTLLRSLEQKLPGLCKNERQPQHILTEHRQ